MADSNAALEALLAVVEGDKGIVWEEKGEGERKGGEFSSYLQVDFHFFFF